MSSMSVPEVQAIQATLATLQSKRARILKGMFLLLQSITKTNGYTITAEEVSFNVKTWRDKTAEQTPVIYIIDDFTRQVKHAGCIREYTWTIRLFGCLKDKDIITFEEFIADIEQCIYDNNTLFGECNKMEINEISTDNQLFSEINDTGAHLFEVAVDVEFTRKARNAR